MRPLRRYLIAFFLLALFGCAAGCAHLPPAGPLAVRPSSQADAYYHYTRGVLHALNQDYDEALAELERALLFDRNSPHIMIEMATVLLQMNDRDGSRLILERLLKRHPDHIDGRLLLATLYQRMGEQERAILHFRKTIDRFPDAPEAYLLLATAHKNQQDYERAQAVLEELLSRDFENHMAAYQLAHLCLEKNRIDEAKYWLRRTVTIKPDFHQALKELALVLELMEEEEGAITAYRDYLATSPHDRAIGLRLGRMLLQGGRYDESVAVLTELLNGDAIGQEARFSLGMAYLLGNIDFEEAASHFADLLTENPRDDRILYFLASSYQELGKHEEALAHFNRIEPDSTGNLFTPSRIQMSLILHDEERTDEAISLVHSTIALIEDDPDLYALLASLYEEAGHPERAADVLREGLLVLSTNVDLRYRLGLILERTGCFEEAIELMEEILAIDPENAEAMNFIGYTWADRGINLDEAEQLINEAMRLKPGSGHITDSLGWVYFRQGRISEAIYYLEKAFRLLPDDPVIAEHLGDAYQAGGFSEKALEMYRTALEEKPDDAAILEKIRGLEETLQEPAREP